LDFIRFFGHPDASLFWGLASAICALAVFIAFTYRKLYQRFYFLAPYILCSLMLSVGQIWRSNQDYFFALNWKAEIALGVLALASLLEHCWFQLRYRATKVMFWCLATGTLWWWGERQIINRTVLGGLPLRVVWLLLALRCLTIGLVVLFVSLGSRKRLPIIRPFYVEGVFCGIGVATFALTVSSLFDLFRDHLLATSYAFSSESRLFGMAILLMVFIRKEPRREQLKPEVVNRVTQSIAIETERAQRLARTSPEYAALLKSFSDLKISSASQSRPKANCDQASSTATETPASRTHDE
jgi:hypothetical protein